MSISQVVTDETMPAYLVIRPRKLLDCECPYSPVFVPRTQQFQRIIHPHLGPKRQQDLDRLSCFGGVGPCDGFEEFRQGTLEGMQGKSVAPDNVLVFW